MLPEVCYIYIYTYIYSRDDTSHADRCLYADTSVGYAGCQFNRNY